MRKLLLTEEQSEAVKEALGGWDVYATMKGDDCVDPDDIREIVNKEFPELIEHSDEWFEKYEELCEAEVIRFNNIGGSMKEVLDVMTNIDKKTPTTDTDRMVDIMYNKHLWDWKNGQQASETRFSGGRIADYMWDAVPNAYTELIEAIYHAEFPDKILPADEDSDDYDPDVADDFYDTDPEWLACEATAKLIIEYDL